MRDRNTARGGGWIDSFDASYAYGRTWFLLGFPLLGLLGIYLAWVSGSGAAQIVALAAELLFILVFVEYRTYYVRIKNGAISKGSILHAKAFPLTDVDLVQHVRGAHNERILYIRHSDTILLKVSGELVGFEDLLGFLREYAKHHHILFATRDGWGEWS